MSPNFEQPGGNNLDKNDYIEDAKFEDINEPEPKPESDKEELAETSDETPASTQEDLKDAVEPDRNSYSRFDDTRTVPIETIEDIFNQMVKKRPMSDESMAIYGKNLTELNQRYEDWLAKNKNESEAKDSLEKEGLEEVSTEISIPTQQDFYKNITEVGEHLQAVEEKLLSDNGKNYDLTQSDVYNQTVTSMERYNTAKEKIEDKTVMADKANALIEELEKTGVASSTEIAELKKNVDEGLSSSIEKEIRKTEIQNLRDFVDYMNVSRQDNEEIIKVYRHVLGGTVLNKGLRPSFLEERPELEERFGMGNKDNLVADVPYTNEHTAAHDLVEFLVGEAEDKIRIYEGLDVVVKSEEQELDDSERGGVDEENVSEKLNEEMPEETDVLSDQEVPQDEESHVEGNDKSNLETEEPLEADPEKTQETLPLDDARSLYLKAKRLRGNVFRGAFGRLFKRKLAFEGEELDFGGDRGAGQLERVRHAYQRSLFENQSIVMREKESGLKARLDAGEITELEYRGELTGSIVELLGDEQRLVDKESLGGIEKNIFEKMKTTWRKLKKTRIAAALLLGGAAVTGVGGLVVAGARVGMGSVGTYTGVEAGLERYSKTIGHRGLVDEIHKERPHYAERDMRGHISHRDPEAIAQEAARLRMLQVEKGVDLEGASRDGKEKAMIVRAIIDRDNELTAQKIMEGVNMEEARLQFADVLSARLTTEINEKNKLVESKVDKERVHKMIRKTTAVIAGAGMGWLLGNKLLGQEAKPDVAEAPGASGSPESPGIDVQEPGEVILPESNVEIPALEHIVEEGDNLWNIDKNYLDSEGFFKGLNGGEQSYLNDLFDDRLSTVTPEQFREAGISSGKAELLTPGDKINLEKLHEFMGIPKNLPEFLNKARNLSMEDAFNIMKQDETAVEWLRENIGSLKKIFDSDTYDLAIEKLK